MSAKNKLQEYTQKFKLPLPIYHSIQTNLGWKSRVHVSTISGNLSKYEGYLKLRKTDAEASAAEKAVADIYHDMIETKSEKISETLDDVLSNFIEHYDHITSIYLIDVENIPQTITNNKYTDLLNRNDTFCIGVIGYLNALTLKSFPDGLQKYVVQSGIANAVDHGITFLAGLLIAIMLQRKILQSETHKRDDFVIYIVTRDKFGEILPKLYPKFIVHQVN